MSSSVVDVPYVYRHPTSLDTAAMQALQERNLPEHYPFTFWILLIYAFDRTSRVAVDPATNEICGILVASSDKIFSLAVDKAHRRRGVATALMRLTLNHPAVHDPVLQVRVSNSVALRLYEKEGFVKKAILDRYYNDPPEDGFLMQCYTDDKNE